MSYGAIAGIAMSGVTGMFAAESELKSTNQDAAAIYATADATAGRRVEDTEDFIDDQKLDYLKAGVGLSGSALLVLRDTLEMGLADAAAIRKEGTDTAAALMRGGRSRMKTRIYETTNKINKGIATYDSQRQDHDMRKNGPSKKAVRSGRGSRASASSRSSNANSSGNYRGGYFTSGIS